MNQGTCWVCTGVGVGALSGKKPFTTTRSFLRTGWNLNPTGKYLSCLLQDKNYDITKLSFSKYRIVLTGFSGTTIYNDQDAYYLQQNSFLFEHINLYSAVPTFTQPQMSKAEQTGCIIGSPYTLQVQGTAIIPFTTNYNYNIPDQTYSGVYNALQEPFYYVPTGSQEYVKFVHSSGRAVGHITGLVSGTFTGSGIISNTFDNYYFYDENNNQVTFNKTITGYAVVGDRLSGTANVLNQSTVNSAIIVGGALSNQAYYTSFISGNDNVSGNLINIPYQQDDVLGFYMLTGSVTGTSSSGYLQYNFPVTGAYDGNVDNIPYYYMPTGFVNASAMVLINFAALGNYDYIEINSNAVSYYSTPNSSYFIDISGLLNTINLQPLLYQVSGIDLNDASFNGQYSGITGIMLYSLLSGASGNNISLTSDTVSGIKVPSGGYLTGGQDLYSLMFGTDQFSGTANGTLYQTGFYNSVLPTGTVYGEIPTYQFTRNFTDVWAISTGLPRNLIKYNTGDNIVAPGQYFASISGDPDIGRYDNLIKIGLNYYNKFGMPTGLPKDVIDLYVTGYNFPSGTGIIFRITGIK
jgi:hypothetical protein